MANEKILIVDDDPAIRQALRIAFSRENMKTLEAADGSQALDILRRESVSLIILDVMMADLDGYDVLRALRADGNVTPVLMLSGRSSDIDQVLGLGMGADDYLTKPFHISVLIQKVKALIRRNNIYSHSQSKYICVGPFRFDLVKLECSKDGVPLALTARELHLLRFFLEHPGQVFTKEQIYAHVWNDTVVDDNTVMVYIRRLREKIEDDSKNPAYIRTIRGIGYVFEKEN